jgi:hypothetical protein
LFELVDFGHRAIRQQNPFDGRKIVKAQKIRDEGIMPSPENSLEERIGRALALPAELRAFSEPFLLAGESLRDFEVVRAMLIDEVRPESFIEWLWALDLVELSWEILRYRHLKNKILDAHRAPAIEAILTRVDGEGMPVEAMPMVRVQARRAAADWRLDRAAAIEIEARLERNRFDAIDINAETFAQARELFVMFDHLMHSAQDRRIGLLREISFRREFARRARRVARLVDDV